ncbi:MAG: kelch repeat-containing protein, partial [Acidobacteriota bacterium]
MRKRKSLSLTILNRYIKGVMDMRLGGLLKTVVFALITVSPMSLVAEDTWTQKTDMPAARFGLSTSVVDGRIYAFGGGVNRGVMVRNVQEYNPATDSWVEKADMPTDNCWFSTSVVDGKIYVIGGWLPESGRATVEEYNPATDTWTTKADMPTPRKFLSTSVVNGRIYAIGGLNVDEM